MDIYFLRDVIFFGKYSSFFCNCVMIADNASKCSCYTLSVSEFVVLLSLVAFAAALALFLLKRKVFS